jgi:ribonucleotide reductase alpha subunit
MQTANIYTRNVLSGKFTMVNKYLVKELTELDLWNTKLARTIMSNDGSLVGIPGIPSHIMNRFKTVWEHKQRHVIDMSADRGPFVDQSQSLNLFLMNPSIPMLTSMHLYSWKAGLKTMMYYLRTRAATESEKFTAQKVKVDESESDEECLMCSA